MINENLNEKLKYINNKLKNQLQRILISDIEMHLDNLDELEKELMAEEIIKHTVLIASSYIPIRAYEMLDIVKGQVQEIADKNPGDIEKQKTGYEREK